MWSLTTLKSSYDSLKNGNWDVYDKPTVEDIIRTHATHFVLHEKDLSEKQKKRAVEAINEMSVYFEKRFATKPAPETKDKKSPTQVYKDKFGVNPTDAYRSLFGAFDKKEYAKWLINAVK